LRFKWHILYIKDKGYTHVTKTALLTGRAREQYAPYIITAPTRLGTTYTQHPCRCKNEFKHKDNTIKGRQPPNKNTEILIRLYLIINDF
jgi:hypothetical protein